MNTIRCFFPGAIISRSMLALGGDMQAPGKSDPAPTPTPTAAALTRTSTSDGLTQPMLTKETPIVWQGIATMLTELLLTIY
jgi:hypothetical protein